MKNNPTTEERLKDARFLNLSEVEGARAWENISSRIEARSHSSLWLLQTKYKKMIPLLIAAIMLSGAGGTAVAANSAAPGDVLFPLDRAFEKVRITFSSKDNSVNLKARFAEERLFEVRKLIAQSRAQVSASTTATSTTSVTATSTATSTATTTPPRKPERVVLGVNFAIAYLNEIYADVVASGNTEAANRIKAVVTQLESLANNDDVKVKLKKSGDFKLKLSGTTASSTATSTASTTGSVKINTSGNKDRIEIREDGDRIRIEIKKGDVKVKVKSDDDNDDEEDDDRDDDDDDDDDDDKRGKRKGNSSSTLRVRLR